MIWLLALMCWAELAVILALAHHQSRTARDLAHLRSLTDDIEAGVRAGLARERAYEHLVAAMRADGDEP